MPKRFGEHRQIYANMQ